MKKWVERGALFSASDYIYSLMKNTYAEKIYRHVYYGKEKKKKRVWGEYKDKTFYVIRVRYDNVGIMAYYRYVLCKVLYAIKCGYVPVVDMQNGKNAYLDIKEVGGNHNSWEDFFEQPLGYTLKDISKAKNIIFSSLNVNEPECFYNKEIYDVSRKYIRFNADIEKRICDITNQWKEKGIQYVLGLKLRGTDYVSTKPKHHSMQPTISEFVSSVDGYMNKIAAKVDLLFLATEDESIRQGLKENYKDKIYSIDIERLNSDETWYNSKKFLSDKKKSGIEYCVEVGVLSRCDALIASGSQGTMVARIMNGDNYDFIHLVNQGKTYQ